MRDANGRFVKSADEAGNAVDTFGHEAAGVFTRMPSLADIAVGALHKVGEIAVTAFIDAGRAAVGFFKDSISAAGDFEAGMNQFSAVAGGALDDAGLKTKDFRDLFISLGKELPVSTGDVQQAAIEMIKGGIDPATVAAGGLKQNIQFAAAAMGGDLAGAATVSAKILGGWASQTATAEEKAKLLTDATDLLTKAANASTVDVKELALGLYNVQGTAKTTGLSLEETTTALAELSPRFASSSEAGTSFKNFLVRLQPTTKPAIAAMESLGLYTEETGSAFFDANGTFIGVAKASQLLHDRLEGLTDAQRVSLLQTMFGNDAMNAAAAFAESGAKGYDDMAAAMAKANGVQANANTMQQGYNVALDNFHGSIEALQITIGSAFLPILTDLFNNYLAPGINTLTDLAEALSGDSDAFGRLSPAVQAVSLILAQLWSDMQTGYGYIQTLIAAFQSTGDESSTLGSVLTDLGSIWTLLTQTVQDAAASYQAIIDAVLPIVQDVIGEHGDEIMAVFQEVWGTIVLIVKAALEVYDAIIPPIFKAIAKFIEDNQADIERIIGNAWTVIKSVIDIALALIQGVIKAALAIMHGDFEGAYKILQQMNERVWNDIKEAIGAIWDTILLLLENIWDDIKKKATDAWDGIVKAIGDPIDDLVEIIKGIPHLVEGVGEAIVNTIWDGIKSKWQEVVDWFNRKLQELRNQLPFSEPKDPTSPLRGLTQSGRAIAEMLQSGLESAGPLRAPPLMRMPAGPGALLAMPVANTATYNQQRTVNLNYQTTYAPPVNHSLAIANALTG